MWIKAEFMPNENYDFEYYRKKFCDIIPYYYNWDDRFFLIKDKPYGRFNFYKDKVTFEGDDSVFKGWVVDVKAMIGEGKWKLLPVKPVVVLEANDLGVISVDEEGTHIIPK